MPDTGNTCLAIEGLSKRFGGFYALNDLRMEVARGHIHALIGPNGAGKTTFFNLVTGVLAADSGQISFDGDVVADARPSRRTLRGIARTFQNIRLFPHLTVLETVMIGEHCRLFPSMWQSFRAAALQLPFVEASQERAMRTSALTLLEFFGLAEKRDAKASDLPYGDQRRLEMARALATQPRLLLLDEPAAGMNPHETHELDELIKRIRDRGVTIVLVEHDMRLVMGISDRITVLNNLRMGAYVRRDKEVGADIDAVFARFPGLAERREQMAGTLSGGEQQMLAIGRALVAHPRLLLLDEPSLGLAPKIVTRIFQTLRELKQEGKTILLVEQNARQALQVADRGYVMERGRIAFSGTGEALLNMPEVRATYLGQSAA